MHTPTLSTVLGVLFLVATSAAQTTSAFHAYGYGCQSCLQLNEDAQTNAAKTLRTQTLPNEYSYGFTATANMRIVGFAMFTKATGTAPFTMGTGFYPADATTNTQPAATATTTGMMTADITAGWYVTKFTVPVAITSGSNYWISGLDSTNILASSILGGVACPLTIYWRRAGTTWSPTGIVSNPGIVLICEGTPILLGTNTPKIPSTNFSIDLSNAASNSLAYMILGVSNTRGPLGPLPSNLGLIGFVGCTLWASNEFTLNGFTTPTGTYSWKLAIPNLTSLDGLKFYVQSFVISTTTSKIAFSNAGHCTAGTN